MRLGEKILATLRNMQTKIIKEAIELIGGGAVDEHTRIARFYLLTEYETREGEEATDDLCEKIGLYTREDIYNIEKRFTN